MNQNINTDSKNSKEPQAFLLIVEKYSTFYLFNLLLYQINNLYIKFMNKIDKILMGIIRYDTVLRARRCSRNVWSQNFRYVQCTGAAALIFL